MTKLNNLNCVRIIRLRRLNTALGNNKKLIYLLLTFSVVYNCVSSFD